MEKLLKETFLKELHLGSNHPGLTEALDRLAAEYRRRGRKGEAKQLSRRVLKIWEEVRPGVWLAPSARDFVRGRVDEGSPAVEVQGRDRPSVDS